MDIFGYVNVLLVVVDSRQNSKCGIIAIIDGEG